MRVCILAAGAAGMVCGSCLRDNALALALRRMGHDASLVPLYTPLKVDGESAARGQVFFGGINVYLQHALGLFRHTPRFVDWLLDRPVLLRAAGNMGAGTPPAKLAGMTRAMLRGEHGDMAKETLRLVEMLRQLRPDVVSLPNLMFIGVAETLRKELGVPVVMELTGEDVFLEAMHPQDQAEIRELIRGSVRHVAAFVATSGYYAAKMSEYLGVPRAQVAAVPPGVPEELLNADSRHASKVTFDKPGVPVLGHLARIDPVKGLDVAQAVTDRVNRDGEVVAFWYAGWDAPQHRKWHAKVRKQAMRPGTYFGELGFHEKAAFLAAIDMFIAPAPYAEPKGLYAIEAMAAGVPVIAANHGAFPEIVGDGGVLVRPGDVDAFAAAVRELATDEGRRRAMSEAGRAAARAKFTDRHMAEAMLAVYQRVLRPAAAAVS